MQTTSLLRKGLPIIVVMLFVAMSISPIAGSIQIEKCASISRSVKEVYNIIKTTNTESRGFHITLSGTKGLNGWYVSPVIIGITSDNGSEPMNVSLKINNGSWFPYTGLVTVTTDGLYSVQALIIDQWGNPWYLGPVHVNIDKTPPELTTTVEKIGFRTWQITVRWVDATSGIGSVAFYFNGVCLANITDPMFSYTMWTVTWKFGHMEPQIMIVACDVAGNKASNPPPINSNQFYRQSLQSNLQNKSPSFSQQYLLQQNSKFLQNLILHQHMIMNK